MSAIDHYTDRLVEKLLEQEVKVQILTTDHYETVARLQKQVFANELGYAAEYLMTPDAYEAHATRLVMTQAGEPVGTLRLHRISSDRKVRLPIEEFLDTTSFSRPDTLMEISKFMLLRSHRKRALCLALMASSFAFAFDKRLFAALVTAFEEVVPMYEKVGMSVAAKPFFNPHARAVVTPMTVTLAQAKAELGGFTDKLREVDIVPNFSAELEPPKTKKVTDNHMIQAGGKTPSW